jgi:hypothetical protein
MRSHQMPTSANTTVSYRKLHVALVPDEDVARLDVPVDYKHVSADDTR